LAHGLPDSLYDRDDDFRDQLCSGQCLMVIVIAFYAHRGHHGFVPVQTAACLAADQAGHCLKSARRLASFVSGALMLILPAI
jgi:hypothetical protein